MLDALVDLTLGSACTVCDRPGRVLCRPCEDALPRQAAVCWPTPRPVGLVTPVACGAYDGSLKLLVNAHKEHQRIALARPLGDLLAVAVLAHAGPAPCGERRAPRGRGVVLVPVPSRPSVVRRRGHDPLLRVARRAAGRLRGLGVDAQVRRWLRSARAVDDQAGLGAVARARNLRGSLAPTRAALVAGRADASPMVLVVDDVVTTGATVREAQRALEQAGLVVHGVAAVAATRRRLPDRSGPVGSAAHGSGTVLPFSGTDD